MVLASMLRRAAMAIATGATLASSAQAQVIDFLTSNGGFTSQTLDGQPDNAWTWTSGTGWTVNGVPTVARQRLLSPLLRFAGGAFSITAVHRFNFDQNALSPEICFDGGSMLGSVNGGAFSVLPTTSGTSYTGIVSRAIANPLGGLAVFCGAQTTNVTSTWSGSAVAGSTLRVALDGGWDASFAQPNPNWSIRELRLTGFAPATVVPEPSTYALLATGLAALVAVSRRRKG
jgi:hypothetical protein